MNETLDGLRRLGTMILDNLSTAVLLFDRDLRLRYINIAGENLLAVSAKTVLGEAAGCLVPCPADAVEDRLRESAPCCRCILSTSGYELLMELHQVDRQLRITREEHLISQHQATQALLRGLAHEIKNPLGGCAAPRSCSSASCRPRSCANTPASSSTRPIACRRC
jgi:two-component system nitrogen regulation sensor histidine kinase GlnL